MSKVSRARIYKDGELIRSQDFYHTDSESLKSMVRQWVNSRGYDADICEYQRLKFDTDKKVWQSISRSWRFKL